MKNARYKFDYCCYYYIITSPFIHEATTNILNIIHKTQNGKAEHSKAKQSKAKHRQVKQSTAITALQSKGAQIEVKQSASKQSKAKHNKTMPKSTICPQSNRILRITTF